MSEAQFYSAGSPATYKRYRYVFGTADYDGLKPAEEGGLLVLDGECVVHVQRQ